MSENMEYITNELSVMKRNFDYISRKLEIIDEMNAKISDIENKVVNIDRRVTDIDNRVKTIESLERNRQHDIALESPTIRQQFQRTGGPQYHPCQVASANREKRDETGDDFELRDIDIASAQRGMKMVQNKRRS